MNRYIIHTGQFGYPQPENDPRLPATFDYSNGCATCGIGKVQYAPVRFSKEPKVTNKTFTGLNWVFSHFFVTDTGRRVLEDNGITGMRFSRPVVHKTGEPLERWFQMEPASVLPPAIRLDGLMSERCERPSDKEISKLRKINPDWEDGPYCGRVKYNVPTDENWNARYVVDECVLDGQPDIVRACEWMGSGGSAFQEIIASQRFKDVCDQNKLRGLFFHPAKLI